MTRGVWIWLCFAVFCGSVRGFIERVTMNDNMESVMRYGTYCGPGPEDDVLLSNATAIDVVDAACQVHDYAYYTCHQEFRQRSGYDVPAALNQFMSLRGFLPSFVGRLILFDKEYHTCMHQADKQFLTTLESIAVSNNFPHWWFTTQDTLQATCSFGINEVCFLTYLEGFNMTLSVFRSNVELDMQVMQQIS